MAQTKTRPKIGDHRWFVEWCSKLAFYDNDESGDIDRDSCEMTVRSFSDPDSAAKYAGSVWPKAKETFGVVEITEMEFVPHDEEDAVFYPHIGYWETVSDTEFFEGE